LLSRAFLLLACLSLGVTACLNDYSKFSFAPSSPDAGQAPAAQAVQDENSPKTVVPGARAQGTMTPAAAVDAGVQ
jgi:hypothetical protein